MLFSGVDVIIKIVNVMVMMMMMQNRGQWWLKRSGQVYRAFCELKFTTKRSLKCKSINKIRKALKCLFPIILISFEVQDKPGQIPPKSSMIRHLLDDTISSATKITRYWVFSLIFFSGMKKNSPTIFCLKTKSNDWSDRKEKGGRSKRKFRDKVCSSLTLFFVPPHLEKKKLES